MEALTLLASLTRVHLLSLTNINYIYYLLINLNTARDSDVCTDDDCSEVSEDTPDEDDAAVQLPRARQSTPMSPMQDVHQPPVPHSTPTTREGPRDSNDTRSDGKFQSARSMVQKRMVNRLVNDPRLSMCTSPDSIYYEISILAKEAKRRLDEDESGLEDVTDDVFKLEGEDDSKEGDVNNCTDNETDTT